MWCMHHWPTCSHPTPSLGVWLTGGSLLPMVSQEIVQGGVRPCPAQALSHLALDLAAFLGRHLPLPSVALASRNQVIQS